MCVGEPKFFSASNRERVFWGGGVGGSDEAICFSAQALFGSAVRAD